MQGSEWKLIHLIRFFWTLPPIVICQSSPDFTNRFFSQANQQAGPAFGLAWLAHHSKVPPTPEHDYQVSLSLLTVPSLQPAHIPTVLTRPSGQKLLWFQTHKTSELSSIQAQNHHAVIVYETRASTRRTQESKCEGIYLQTTAATLMTEQEGSQLAS